MIKNIQMQDFKKFNFVDLKDLSHINIILGRNNIGKSTILEGIFALTAGQNLPPTFHNLIARRTGGNILGKFDYLERINSFNQDVEEINDFSFSLSATLTEDNLKYTFKHKIEPSNAFGDINPNIMNGNNNIEIHNGNIRINQSSEHLGSWNIEYSIDGEEKSVEKFPITFPPENTDKLIHPFKFGKFVDILSHREQIENSKIYSFLKRSRSMNEFISELQTTFPEIINIDSIPYMDGTPAPVSFELENGKLVPIYNFGDGLQRWFHILGGLVLYQNAVHCIEEIDSTFHYGAQKELAKNLYKYSQKYNNQLFLTSHSIEFIDNFLTTLYGEETGLNIDDDFVKVITLIPDPENPNGVLSRTLNGRKAYETREEYGLELR